MYSGHMANQPQQGGRGPVSLSSAPRTQAMLCTCNNSLWATEAHRTQNQGGWALGVGVAEEQTRTTQKISLQQAGLKGTFTRTVAQADS